MSRKTQSTDEKSVSLSSTTTSKNTHGSATTNNSTASALASENMNAQWLSKRPLLKAFVYHVILHLDILPPTDFNAYIRELQTSIEECMGSTRFKKACAAAHHYHRIAGIEATTGTVNNTNAHCGINVNDHAQNNNNNASNKEEDDQNESEKVSEQRETNNKSSSDNNNKPSSPSSPTGGSKLQKALSMTKKQKQQNPLTSLSPHHRHQHSHAVTAFPMASELLDRAAVTQEDGKFPWEMANLQKNEPTIMACKDLAIKTCHTASSLRAEQKQERLLEAFYLIKVRTKRVAIIQGFVDSLADPVKTLQFFDLFIINFFYTEPNELKNMRHPLPLGGVNTNTINAANSTGTMVIGAGGNGDLPAASVVVGSTGSVGSTGEHAHHHHHNSSHHEHQRHSHPSIHQHRPSDSSNHSGSTTNSSSVYSNHHHHRHKRLTATGSTSVTTSPNKAVANTAGHYSGNNGGVNNSYSLPNLLTHTYSSQFLSAIAPLNDSEIIHHSPLLHRTLLHQASMENMSLASSSTTYGANAPIEGSNNNKNNNNSFFMTSGMDGIAATRSDSPLSMDSGYDSSSVQSQNSWLSNKSNHSKSNKSTKSSGSKQNMLKKKHSSSSDMAKKMMTKQQQQQQEQLPNDKNGGLMTRISVKSGKNTVAIATATESRLTRLPSSLSAQTSSLSSTLSNTTVSSPLKNSGLLVLTSSNYSKK